MRCWSAAASPLPEGQEPDPREQRNDADLQGGAGLKGLHDTGGKDVKEQSAELDQGRGLPLCAGGMAQLQKGQDQGGGRDTGRKGEADGAKQGGFSRAPQGSGIGHALDPAAYGQEDHQAGKGFQQAAEGVGGRTQQRVVQGPEQGLREEPSREAQQRGGEHRQQDVKDGAAFRPVRQDQGNRIHPSPAAPGGEEAQGTHHFLRPGVVAVPGRVLGRPLVAEPKELPPELLSQADADPGLRPPGAHEVEQELLRGQPEAMNAASLQAKSGQMLLQGGGDLFHGGPVQGIFLINQRHIPHPFFVSERSFSRGIRSRRLRLRPVSQRTSRTLRL